MFKYRSISWKPFLLVGSLIGTGLIISSCTKTKKEENPANSQAETPTDIKIAIAGPHTGAYAAFGEQLWRGSLQAIEDINAAGGLCSEKAGKKVCRKLEAVKADDACEPKQAKQVSNKMVNNEKVDAVVGHFCSSSSMPASETYNEAGVLMITPASTNPAVTDRNLATILRMCGRDDQQGVVAAQFILNTLKAKNVAVIHDKDTYGRGLADAMKAEINKNGIKEVLYEGITRGEKDFNALVTKFKQLKVDVVYFGGLHSEAGPMVRQMRDQGVKASFISGDGIVSNDFLTAAGGPTYAEGVYMTFGKDPRTIPDGKEVVAKFESQKYKPEGYTLYSYATVQVIAAALKAVDFQGGGLAAAKWLKDNSTSVNTVMGAKSWDSKGDLTKSDYVMYQWKKDGSYGEVTL